MLVSVVVPCYNEEAVIRLYYEEMNKVTELLTDYDFELIFVNDGSKDGTLGILKEFASKDNRVKFISFSRNFGKESAMYAGLKNSNGDYVVLMDADLQDPPKTLIDMLRIATEEGYDSVATRRMTRKGEPPIRSFFARQFYKIMNKISKTDIVDGARDYRLMSRNFVDSLLRMSEYSRFSKGLFGWVGFKTKWIAYENVERAAGETKWSFWKLLLYSIEGIVAFSTLPLSMSVLFGIIFAFFSFIGLVFVVIRAAIFGDPVAGWPSMMSIILLIGGVQLICIGILGIYLSKVYLEVKKRPIFICSDSNIKDIKL